MDGTLWSDLVPVIVSNFLVPFAPWTWWWRVSTVGLAITSQPWWIVAIAADLSGIPSIVIMTWIVRHGAKLLSRFFPRVRIPPQRHGVFLSVFLINASPLYDYATALYAGQRGCPWLTLVAAVALARAVHLVPIIGGSAFFSRYPWFRDAMVWLNQPWVMVLIAVLSLAGLYIANRRRKAPTQVID